VLLFFYNCFNKLFVKSLSLSPHFASWWQMALQGGSNFREQLIGQEAAF